MTMTPMLSWLLYAVVIGALLAGAAAALEPVLRSAGRQARSVWCGALFATLILPLLAWLGVDAPLAIPVLPPLWVGGTGIGPNVYLELEGVGGAPFPWESVIAAVWCTASGLLLGRIAFAAVGLHHAERSWRAGEMQGERVWLARRDGPAVVGWVRSRIVVPEWTFSLEDRLQRLMLRHEHEHVRAHDPTLLLAARLAVIAMPWNAALWWQLHRLRLAVEADCDARVLARDTDVQRYGALLLEVGRRRSTRLRFAAALTEPKSFLERRLELMLSMNSKPRLRRTAALLSTAAILAIVAVCAEQPIVEPVPDDVAVDAAAAPEAVPGDVAAAPTFTPFTVQPELKNRDEVMAALMANYPPLLRDAGIGGRAMVWFLIDETGRVADVRIKESSGHDALDDAALRVGHTMEFSPALNQDEAVMVWVALPIVFEAAAGEAEARDRSVEVEGDPLIIIDGVVVGRDETAIRDLSPESIQRIDILKGQAAIERYGPDAVKGVMVITTKREAGVGGAPDLLGQPATELRMRIEASPMSGRPTFTPFTVAPELKNRSEVQEALVRYYPPLLKDAGIGGRTMVWFHIDPTGRVDRLQLKESSGHEALDQAALQVASAMEFTPAENDGAPTSVWVALPIVFEVR